jgi:hypothetical protein
MAWRLATATDGARRWGADRGGAGIQPRVRRAHDANTRPGVQVIWSHHIGARAAESRCERRSRTGALGVADVPSAACDQLAPVVNGRAGAVGTLSPRRSYSEIICAPSSNSVAAISRLNSTAMAVVSEP